MRDDTRLELIRLLALVDEKLSTLPAFTWETRSTHTHALETVCGQLERSEGARFRDSGSNVTVVLGGTRSSSTMGAEYALRNWCKAARDLLALGGVK